MRGSNLPTQVVVKSQILAGGRGLGKFTSGLQGGVHIVEKAKAVELAKQMLGGTLVTKQTGPAGALCSCPVCCQEQVQKTNTHEGPLLCLWPALCGGLMNCN